MKKLIAMTTLALTSFSASAVKIEYDEKNNIIPTQEVCALAESMLKAAALDLQHADSKAEQKQAHHKFEVASSLVARCVDAGFISY